jgi:3'-phosphoadenosine 5'-phosphosulfate sulfotransferase (PAPS reductase)/FAD synthetase
MMSQIINYYKELKLGSKETKAKNRDLRVLSLGAGVQSSTLFYKILNNEIEPVDCAIFADTGNEPKAVYDYLEHLSNLADFPVHIVSKGNIIDDSLAVAQKGTNKGFLTMPVKGVDENGKQVMGRRQCTNDYKIQPINKKIRELLGVKTLRGFNVEVVMGISLDEIQRAKEPINKWQVNCYPLIENKITRHQCLEYIKKHNYKTPPRSACIVCPYHSNKEWLHMKENNPYEFEFAVNFDLKIRTTSSNGVKNYLHSSLKPLGEIDFNKYKDPQYKLFDDECSGICGV